MDSLLDELECPVCSEYLTIPIRLCMTGHSICGNCMSKLAKCPLCQSAFGLSRNITLEKLASKIKYPCSNVGCTQMITYLDREKHNVTCEFKVFLIKCAASTCNFMGDRESLKKHWLSKNSNVIILKPITTIKLLLENACSFVNLVEAYEQLFWYKIKAVDNTLFFTVQFIGNVEEARNYYFEVQIANPFCPRQKILISDYCTNLNLPENELFMSDTSCQLEFSYLEQFSENDYVNFSLKLFKIDEEPNL